MKLWGGLVLGRGTRDELPSSTQELKATGRSGVNENEQERDRRRKSARWERKGEAVLLLRPMEYGSPPSSSRRRTHYAQLFHIFRFPSQKLEAWGGRHRVRLQRESKRMRGGQSETLIPFTKFSLPVHFHHHHQPNFPSTFLHANPCCQFHAFAKIQSDGLRSVRWLRVGGQDSG